MSIRAFAAPPLIRFRRPLRAGRLFAILDATSFANLPTTLQASGLPHASLFGGDDAVLLEGEAPYICALPGTQARAVRDLLQSARHPHAGFIIESGADMDTLRRHYKNWLTVTLEEGQDMALFRFYDARILLAFTATLTGTDANAFMGSVDRLVAVSPDHVVELTLGSTLPGISSARYLKGMPYAISPAQTEALTLVTDEVFRGRAKRFLRSVFWEQAEDLPEPTLDTLVAGAISDCGRLGVCREGDVIKMLVTRLLRPDLVEDDAYWDAVIDQRPNPNQRAGAFIGEIAHDMPDKEKQIFYAQLNYWWDFEKDET